MPCPGLGALPSSAASGSAAHALKTQRTLFVFDFPQPWLCLCRAGTYSKSGAGACTGCPRGTYSRVGSRQCFPCPAGTYNGKNSQGSCTAAPAGSFAPGLGNM